MHDRVLKNPCYDKEIFRILSTFSDICNTKSGAMKRLLIFILLSCSINCTVKAQEVEIGVRAGMNVTNLGRSGYLDRIGYNVGMTAEFVTTPFFSILTELQYSLQGAALDRSQNIFLNYHYLNIPLMAKVYFYEDASFELGAQYGYLLKAMNKSDFYNDDITGQVNRHDFAIVIGLTYKLSERWNAGVRYNLGISNTQNQDTIYENRRTNRVLQISVGWLF
jgi:hypothetical protein